MGPARFHCASVRIGVTGAEIVDEPTAPADCGRGRGQGRGRGARTTGRRTGGREGPREVTESVAESGQGIGLLRPTACRRFTVGGLRDTAADMDRRKQLTVYALVRWAPRRRLAVTYAAGLTLIIQLCAYLVHVRRGVCASWDSWWASARRRGTATTCSRRRTTGPSASTRCRRRRPRTRSAIPPAPSSHAHRFPLAIRRGRANMVAAAVSRALGHLLRRS